MPRKKHSEEREARRFAVILVILLAAFGGLSLWRHHPGRAWGMFGAAATVALLRAASFPLWMRVFRLWMKLALVLSWVMTRVILSVFFYLVLAPVGVVMRLLGKAPLDLAWRDGKASYWIDKAPVEATIERYEKSF
jgi:saxitoxin biosynthesis operon SxtJ-like protein